MKRLCLSKNNTKQGVASLYVVLFTSILFGVITLSFTRIIISESEQSSEDDLSQSAYDAAMAGVEDAKRVVNDYYRCLSGNTQACDNIHNANPFSARDVDRCTDQFPLASILYGTEEEIKIQEGNSPDEVTQDTYQDQAYTCVLIRDTVPDYRGTLTSDTRTKVIPLGINRDNAPTSYSEVRKIRFSWHSQINLGSTGDLTLSNGTFPDGNHKTVPPVIQLTLIKTGETIDLDALRAEDNTGDVINSTMILLPTDNIQNKRVISWNEVVDAGNASDVEKDNNDAAAGTRYSNQPFLVKCTTDDEFACTVDIQVDSNALGNKNNLILVASLPYGDAYTDFAASLLDSNDNAIPLKGVQVSVDSTGRTNQLYRRVEVRLDPADLYFPYPQYALEIDGSGPNSTVDKNFWVTANCWATNPAQDNGMPTPCDNNGTVVNSGSSSEGSNSFWFGGME